MTNTTMFSFVSIAWWVLQLAAPFMFMYIKWNRHLFLRAVVAVMASWLIIIFYTSLIYNPAGVAAGIEQGMDSPLMRYDNNTVSVAILAGWFYPLISVLACTIFLRYRHRAQQGAQNGPR